MADGKDLTQRIEHFFDIVGFPFVKLGKLLTSNHNKVETFEAAYINENSNDFKETRQIPLNAIHNFVQPTPPPPRQFKPPITFLGAPTKIGDMTQAYRYGFVLDSPDHEALKGGFDSNQFQFEIEQSGEIIYALLMGRRVGLITVKCDMISDWLSRGWPMRLYLNNYIEDQDCKLILVFYKDKSASHKWREQSVIPLSAYKSKSRQEISAYLQAKEEVEIGEEHFGNDDDDAVVTYRGEAIGKVSAKIRERIAEDGYAFAEVEEVTEEQNDNGDEIYHPIIRIYW